MLKLKTRKPYRWRRRNHIERRYGSVVRKENSNYTPDPKIFIFNLTSHITFNQDELG